MADKPLIGQNVHFTSIFSMNIDFEAARMGFIKRSSRMRHTLTTLWWSHKTQNPQLIWITAVCHFYGKSSCTIVLPLILPDGYNKKTLAHLLPFPLSRLLEKMTCIHAFYLEDEQL